MSADMRGVGAKSTSPNTQKCSRVAFSQHATFWGKEELGCLTTNRQHRPIGNSPPGLWLHMSGAIRLVSTQIPALISTFHQALAGLGKPEPEDAGRRIPAVSLRQSVRPDYIVCLDCGRRSKMLRRHLADAHGLSTDEYRKRWNLRSDYPMVAPAYSERRSGLAKQLGLGRGRRKSTASDTASEPESATTS